MITEMLAARDVIDIGPWGLAISALLVLVCGAISVLLRLGLEKRLAIASLRTVVQLFLVGFILRYVFNLDTWWAVLGVMCVMIVLAARAAVQRPSRTFAGAGLTALLSLVVSATLVTFTVTAAIIGVVPWYKPQYVIPLLGMILGNGLTGISLCLNQLLETLDQRRSQVEMQLACGATRWEAARGPLSDAVRRGMIPIINSMMVVGTVSLPGMMTGQILAGSDPLVAVKYQIMVMFMIAAGTALASMGMALLVYRRMFNTRHQLRWQLIHRKNKD
ncbi:MAG: ABC transporter permease [Phycisphaerae bacterium]